MKIRIDPLDTKFSKMIRTKKPICESCHTRSSSQVHHFKGRRHQSVRFDPDNAWALCFTCHRKFHEDPEYAVVMAKARLGIRYDSFILKANMIRPKYTVDRKLLSLWMDQEILNTK